MTRRVQDEKPPRSRDAQAWLAAETEAQAERHAAIQKEMNEDLAPQRERWYRQFLETIQAKGFNANGDQRVRIGKAQVPRKPDRPHRVVY